jgi:hypothetical protein
VKFSGAHVKLDNGENKRQFNWAEFKDSIDSYTGDDLFIDEFKSTTISLKGSTVAIMAEKIAQFLAHVTNGSIDQTELTAVIEDTYTNLKAKSSDGFLHFSQSGNGQNSSWEYRFQFAFPNENIPNSFYSVVTTIKLEANLSNESDWWALDRSSAKDFSATIDAMELMVEHGFRSPK